MKNLFKGAVDLHVHAGPSLAAREVDAAEMSFEAQKYDYKAFVVKDHYFPTMMSATIVKKHLAKDGVEVFGGLCLNNSVGGINVKAIDAACAMGAKFICMPTVSSKNHIDKHQGGHFLGAGNLKLEENPIVYINEKGELLPEVEEALSFIAQYPDVILYTGHGCLQEIDALVVAAVKAGIKKILVNHPFYIIDADINDMIKWSKLGAFIEVNAVVFRPTKKDRVEYTVAAEIFEKIDSGKIVLDSDYGQRNNGSPAEGLMKFTEILINEYNVPIEKIEQALKTNPSYLLSI